MRKMPHSDCRYVGRDIDGKKAMLNADCCAREPGREQDGKRIQERHFALESVFFKIELFFCVFLDREL